MYRTCDRRQHGNNRVSWPETTKPLCVLPSSSREAQTPGPLSGYPGRQETRLAASPKRPQAVFLPELPLPAWATEAAPMLQAVPFRGGILLATRRPPAQGSHLCCGNMGAQLLHLLRGSQVTVAANTPCSSRILLESLKKKKHLNEQDHPRRSPRQDSGHGWWYMPSSRATPPSPLASPRQV